MEPILFNTEMTRAIQNGTKTATRRVVKPQPAHNADVVPSPRPWTAFETEADMWHIKPPYRPGDILYVRETWGLYHQEPGFYVYKADKHEEPEFDGFKWHPSIHMPREAARIFLRVTDVNVQRVQDITEEEARKEGCKDREDYRRVWNDCYANPRPVKVKGVIDHYESYPWEDIQETRTYRGKPWYVIGNPLVLATEFERCEKPEGVLG